jgi:hypothetical protein
MRPPSETLESPISTPALIGASTANACHTAELPNEQGAPSPLALAGQARAKASPAAVARGPGA